MKVGILGSGDVAKTLGAGFMKHGHQVTMGTRHPEKLADWSTKGTGAQVASFSEAAKFGELVVLAVQGAVAAEALRAAGVANLEGKTVIDVTNPLAGGPTHCVLKFFTTLEDSLMERLQKEFPSVQFVKAFSCVGAASMVNPAFKNGPPTMFICGNDDHAKQTVKGILYQFGWDTEDMGRVEAARAIEPLSILWCIPGFLHNDWVHALKMLR
jgi:8-hydroxy-5-deazaflavin:NADPH oxidoreductase